MSTDKNFLQRRKKPLLIAGVLILIAVIVILNMQSQREKALKVTIEKVKSVNLTSTISASGEVKPKKNVNISAHIPGRIERIGVIEGQRVKNKDFLLKLESTQYEANADRDRARIQSLKADLIRTEAVLKRDEKFLERQIKLYDEKLISSEQLESSQAQYDISKAHHDAILFQIKQAEASLTSTMDSLQKTVFYSPIDGIITSLRVEEGEIALVGTMNNPGTVLMTIADLSVMEVEVDETDVVGVELNQEAEIRVDAFPDIKIMGNVTEIGSSALQKVTASQESKDFKVVITLENPPANLKPGLSASADIITARKQGVLAIPISALVIKDIGGDAEQEQESQQEGVFTVDKDRAKFQPVQKGIMGELKIEIVSGLEEEQKIVVGPYSALRELKDDKLIKTDKSKEEDK